MNCKNINCPLFTVTAKESRSGKNGVAKYSARNKKFKYVKYFQKTSTSPTLTGMNPLPLSTLDDNGVAYANFWNLYTVYYHEIPPWTHEVVDTGVQFHLSDDFVSRGYFPMVTGVGKFARAGLLIQTQSTN